MSSNCLLALLFAVIAVIDCKIGKRALPLSYNCNLNQPGSCHKGDLISKDVADCKRDSLFITCDPINNHFLSSVVDIPDVGRHNVNCGPKRGLPVRCGSADTRCVCDKAIDIDRPLETIANQCRCQYWPAVDSRTSQPSYCTQYDHGGQSGVHFFTCCNNCNDTNRECAGQPTKEVGALMNIVASVV